MCDQCEALMINGVYCHETGCPNAWKDERRECKECGTVFKPEERGQRFCSLSCQCNYNGVPNPEDEQQSEMRELTDAEQKKYIHDGADYCPYCGHEDIEGGFVDISGGTAFQPVHCNSCGSHWDDCYTLTSMEARPEKKTIIVS